MINIVFIVRKIINEALTQHEVNIIEMASNLNININPIIPKFVSNY